MINHTAIQYAVLFSGTLRGKRYAEMTNSVDTLTEAFDDARTCRADGNTLMGLYQIDYITRTQVCVKTGRELDDLFDAEEEANHFREHATDADMDRYCMTGMMSVGAA